MAGHSQFKNIMYRKGAQDSKRARMFAKLSREITVAARTGLPDPAFNPRLRSALSAARVANMPKDNIEKAIKKSTSTDLSDAYEEVRYEGYGPGSVAFIVEALTDNKNRTASDIRSLFTKYGGNLGETGSVSFQFEHIGYFLFNKNHNFDKVFEYAINSGAEDVEEIDEHYEIICNFNDFSNVRDDLTKKLGDPVEAKNCWRAITEIECSENTIKTIEKLIDSLEDLDDVQNVYTNLSWKD